MSTEPTLALQEAIVTALKADVTLTDLIESRVYDRIPKDHLFPYVRVGEDQALDNGADCLDDAVTVFSTIHVFTRNIGKIEGKRIAGAVKRRLHLAENLTLDDNNLILIIHEGTDFFTDPDGLTEHGVIRFRSEIEPH